MDYRTLEIVQGLREIAEELIQKQDVYDKRLKDVEDNFHNQSERQHDGVGSFDYGSTGKDTNREDIKAEDTKETITNAQVQKGDGYEDDDEDEEEDLDFQKSLRKGKKLAKGANKKRSPKLLRKHDMDEHMGQVDVDDVDMDATPGMGDGMGEDFFPEDDDMDEVDEIRDMYKQSMSMMKGILKSQMKQTDYLVKKLEELTKAKEDEGTSGPQLLSTLPIRKSADDNMHFPARGLGGVNGDDVGQMNMIVKDYDDTLEMITKGAVNSHGDVSEAALARINKWRLELGDLETPAMPTYNTGVPGM